MMPEQFEGTSVYNETAVEAHTHRTRRQQGRSFARLEKVGPKWMPRRPAQMLLTCLVLALAVFSIQPRPAAALEREDVNKALRAAVQVIVPDSSFEMFSAGSGTIISADGLVLTNYHVVEGDLNNGLMNEDGLAGIAITPADLRGEAILKYFGVVVKSDPELDLALIQIVSLADDPEAPLPDNLGLTPIPLGDSDDLMISDEVNMFGFPTLGGSTATYTQGIVSGFLDEDRDGIYEWIKTDAELNYGNSGGLATDDQGRFIGVPTAGNTDEIGKIGLVRTGNVALDFVNSYFPTPGGDGPAVSSVQYAQAITRRGEPIAPAAQFDTGITDLYAVFDFAGFEDGQTLSYTWYLEGVEIARDSFAWDAGANGTSWVSMYDDEGLDEGYTELELVFDGIPVYRGGVLIGEGLEPEPIELGEMSLGPITFAEEVSSTGAPMGAGALFSDVDTVYALFDYAGMRNGTAWTARWYLDDQMVLENEGTWDAGESGGYEVSLYHPDGLPDGRYALELYVEGELLQSGEFDVQNDARRAAGDVNLIGTVIDRNNSRQTISGATVVLLTPGVTIDQWIDEDFPDSMVHGIGTSGRNGNFQLDVRVTPGEYYSTVVLHDDYEPIAVDDYQIPPDTTDPYELEVSMDRG